MTFRNKFQTINSSEMKLLMPRRFVFLVGGLLEEGKKNVVKQSKCNWREYSHVGNLHEKSFSNCLRFKSRAQQRTKMSTHTIRFTEEKGEKNHPRQNLSIHSHIHISLFMSVYSILFSISRHEKNAASEKMFFSLQPWSASTLNPEKYLCKRIMMPTLRAIAALSRPPAIS